ncbi:MAG: S8 family serine peptidase, partial [Bryobacteraceae bacterium]
MTTNLPSHKIVRIPVLFLLAAAVLAAQTRMNRYAVVLSDAPLAAEVSSRKELRNTASIDRQRKIEGAQTELRHALAERHLPVTGSLQTLLNVVFVKASPEEALALRTLPGVTAVRQMRKFKRHLFTALDLMNVPAAWNVVGGAQNAGAGVKIGVIDSGIDQTHAAFQDDSLTVPAGFPKCQASDCAYTNKKVIVARSYVEKLSLFYGDDPLDTRPDDFSPRDRVGHGTAVAMIAAGATNKGPAGTITGVAPKAFLGNYKVFGSPGVNDGTFEDTAMVAMEDAAADGMDIVTLSLGSPALCGPNDTNTLCGDDVDLYNAAVNNAVRLGMTVVASAGNDGDLGYKRPSLNSIHSPGTAPAAITVGATDNTHDFFQSVTVSAPTTLQRINTLFGNGPKPPGGKLTAPLRDVAKVGNDGLACSALPAGSLNGTIALILRGTCLRDQKVNNAQKAGAVGVIIYQTDGLNALFQMRGMENTSITAVLVGNTDGVALKNLAASSPDKVITLDITPVAVNDPNYDVVALFSSHGPSIGESAIKPEVVAVGTGLYVATQKYDPNGDLYDPSGYTAVQGTSFAAPMVAGAAALVKQRNPGFTPAQIKSAVVNTASEKVDDYDANDNLIGAPITAMGAGKLDAGAAVKTNVTVEPSTLSFGVIASALPSQALTFRNAGTAAVTLTLAVQSRTSDAKASVTLSASTLSIAAGQSGQVTARLAGAKPQAGSYEGVVTVAGGAVPLHIPYLYLVGDGVPYSFLTLTGDGFVRDIGAGVSLTFKVVDQFGVPVSQTPVRFQSTLGGGSIRVATETTDVLGIAQAQAIVGQQPGDQEFTASAAGLTVYFDGTARTKPVIQAGAVVNAASLQAGQGLAPGSYISIYGNNLSESTRVANTPYLPLSLAGVSVSFDIQSKKISLPARLQFVS